ncbi:hypothetical protein COZ61_02220 [Candidatus Berkelbacteria bacterium CG_4_8_14_3_um_filter_33_6]|nr:MAG: hypothetical protein COT76_00845 [Candidatus Berkelbacteria bacterium CG10_big_fil_rev_8_21_14_0_10_33_10]PIX30981.1 MAG: hypothetical protein COZ61_02220 [Candidatus Berkelbacteria bacterium CG_4_8_14_3_um_filter_33_6]
MNKSSYLTVFLIFFILVIGGGASALAVPNYEEGDTILPPNFEYGQGPKIAGDLYPPFGDQWDKTIFGSKETYRSGKPHSDFASHHGFSNHNSSAIDLTVRGDNDPYIYATFDGIISDIILDHKSNVAGGKHSGQVLWLYDASGKNEAIYAHIRIDKNILANYNSGNKKITKGTLLGRIATRENMKEIGYQYALNSPHLHFQLWLNSKAQTGDQIETWKY